MAPTKSTNAEVVILGAGPAGISAALTLGSQAVILERRSDIGGLSGSMEINGAIFDIGSHSFHTPHPEVKELVYNNLEMYEQKREARCYSHGTLISYPFQKHFRQLEDRSVIEECEQGLRGVNRAQVATNFEEYLQNKFGWGIAKHFLFPYNRKLWKKDLQQLSAKWANQRVAAPEGVQEQFDSHGGERKPLQDDTMVAYPARGGFGEIAKAMIQRVEKLLLGVNVWRVDPNNKKLMTENGEVFHWQRLISTIPINDLLRVIDNVPASLRKDAGRLEYLSLKLVFVVIGCPVKTEIQRIYLAQPDLPAHKIVINNNSSDYLRSLKRHGITGEISYSSEEPFPYDNIEDQFVKLLIHLNLIQNTGEIISASTLDVNYAYPIPTLDRERIVIRLKEWLEARNIYSIGRFGEWDYINSDEAIHRGVTRARSITGAELQA